MATKRLNDSDRSMLRNSLQVLLKRLEIAEEEPEEFTSNGIAKAKQLLLAAAPPDALPHVLALESAGHDFSLATDFWHHLHLREFSVYLRAESYRFIGRQFLPDDHPDFDRLYSYCQRQYENDRRYKEAWNTCSSVINACSSAGQLVRVLPFIKSFLPPKALNSLDWAERKSRWPGGIPSEFDMRHSIEHLHNTLALCQLLPEYSYAVSHDAEVELDERSWEAEKERRGVSSPASQDASE